MKLLKKVLFLLTILLAIGIIAGCGGSSSGNGKINGLLTHSDEITPYPHINVVLYTNNIDTINKLGTVIFAETKTDINGKFYFENIPAGNYKIVFEAVGSDDDLDIVAGTNTLHYSID